MPGFLKQSTASQVIEIGPFLDDTDFKTAETALTIANTDIKLRKNTTSHASKNSGGGTHIANGYYYATLDATDTATVGLLDVHVNVSGALPVFDRYYVVEEAIYDMLFGASALGYIANAPVNVAQFGGSNLTAASGIPEVKVASLAANAITATAINADALTAAKVASDVGTEIAAAVMTTAMTESYNADGAAPTPAQALFLILQMLTEKSISSTTLTVKKLDGSTSAATFTLNDATNPTSITRAT